MTGVSAEEIWGAIQPRVLDLISQAGMTIASYQTIGDEGRYLPLDGSRGMEGHLLPALPDTHDIGSSTRMFRKAWISEIDAVIFAENTVSLLGGWLVVGKGEGSLAADVAAADTTIDFGKVMTPGHFVLMRAALKVEYMQVGTQVSGTTYNVTRNLDGSGANDWAAGTPYAILGTTGDGRIELNAYDTPRLSIIRQGATYNAQTEVVRIGDLNGAFGVSAERYGFGAGDYAAGNYLKFDPTGGFQLKAGGGNIVMEEGGVYILPSSSYLAKNAYGFRLADGTVLADLSAYYNASLVDLTLAAKPERSLGRVNISGSGSGSGEVNLRALGGARTSQVTLGSDGTDTYVQATADALILTGVLKAMRDSVMHTVYAYHPFADGEILTNVGWDGDDTKTTGTYTIDTSAWGLPTGVKAVNIFLSGVWATAAAGNNAGLRAAGGSTNQCILQSQVNNIPARWTGTINCDANGDFSIVVSGASMTTAVLRILGYYI